MAYISETLRELLVRDGMSSGSLAGDDERGMKKRGAADGGALSQSGQAQEGESLPVLVWTNMTLTQRTAPRGRVRLVSAT